MTQAKPLGTFDEKLPAFAHSVRGIAAIYSGLAILFTWPLAWHAATHIPGGATDIWQNYWNFWWWREALVQLGTHPLWTELLFHPHGASLALHTHSFFNQIVALPVNLAFGPAAALNFATLLTFVLAGIAAHQLAFEVCGDRGAAYAAGLVYAFFPHHFEQSLEHLNLASIQFLPWVALYGMRIAKKKDARSAGLFGFVFALNALACWHYGLFTLFFVPILWLGELLRHEDKRTGLGVLLRNGTIALCVATVVLLPVVILMYGQLVDAGPYLKAPMNKGIDLSFLFVPSDHHPWLGWLTEGFYTARRSYPSVGSQAFMGYSALALAGVALWTRHRGSSTRVWTVILLVGLVLALGSQPTIAGRTLDISLPHMQFKYLPLLDGLRVANRFVVIAMLALSVLAAVGFSAHVAGRAGAATAWLALVVFEFLWTPYPMRAVEFSPLFERFADEAEGAILDIPLFDHSGAALNLAYQTRHGRPIAGGYVSVTPRGEASLANDPVLWRLAGVAPKVPERIDVDHLRNLGFSHVVLHKDRTRGFLAAQRAALGRNPDFYGRRQFRPNQGIVDAAVATISERLQSEVGEPAFEDERVRVFRLER